MRLSGKQTKRAVSLLLCLALLVSMTAFVLSVRAEEVDELADTGADTYYLWGENSNSPNFNASTPTGTFTYDSSKGYYYYDLTGSSGDYCFVVSTISNSANYAVRTPAVQTVASSGSYYLTAGNYHGYNCMHLWNPSGDAIRIYFTSASAGLNAVKAGSEVATQAPTATQAPATQASTQKPTSGGGTTPTTAQNPTQSQPDTGKTYVYCENEAGWSAVYAYMWNSESDKNASWPGVKMTNIGGNIWRYEYTKSYAKIIFNVGSNQTQTSDLTFPGKDYIFNNKTNSWEVYDTSPLQVSSFTTDLEAPQYNGVGIVLSAAAEGQGTVYYKFSVVGSTGTRILSDFSTKNSVQWIPQTAGTYSLTYDFKDAAGNTNQRTKTYVIEDGLNSVAPYIKTVSPAPGEIENNKTVSVNVTAGGGITGTNLLFYKFTVKDSTGNTVNTPYYTLSGNYSFKPSSLGAYSLTVDVQGSDNKTVERTYNYISVGELTPIDEPETQPPTTYVEPTSAAMPTDPVTAALYGDADDDGDVTVIDVTFIQRYEANISLPSPLNKRNADVDGDDDVTILDATYIQRFNAGIIKKFPVES